MSRSTQTTLDTDPLVPIAVEALRMRSLFLDHIRTLPAAFSELVVDHYLDRMVRAGGRHMLGEYTPLLLADVLQIPRERALDFALPWLVLYEHALLLDDAIDVKGPIWRQHIIASQVLFDDFVSLWRDRFLKYPDLWGTFCKYHEEAAWAALEEVRRSPRTIDTRAPAADSYGPEAHLNMGRKIALVKFCATGISIEYRNRFLNSREEVGLDSLCAGIQLLDDLADSVEDYAGQKYTFPLRTALEWLDCCDGIEVVNGRALTRDQLIVSLIGSGVITQISRLVQRYLTVGLAELQIPCESTAGKYVLWLIETYRDVGVALDDLVAGKSDIIKAMLCAMSESEDAFQNLLREPIYKITWREMRGSFKKIAVASN